jgi:hypothetical protein
LGENFVYPTAIRKTRKDRATHESSAPDRRRDSNIITTESRKISTSASPSLLAHRGRALEAEIQNPLDKSGRLKHFLLPQASMLRTKYQYSIEKPQKKYSTP